ncbi:uncharacterized protein NP_2226A [Natronomonas pharaonis DSM 2160]|uniref:Uncharacterized protein n=1 Tax=Natronomonas pharaonis (strain ATCC 35678 / DSM 2160 / CIP 103997 / JCM 8858 / NBRC 14720 / NCIMB 2260 / Gabara) TaxID=348780 RepID=A0A1U7EVX2_NATPD|nr:hypothetical protein [Natronomonas pharaonis]CAI49204.1 uncharacterized protein NP_2226A [Natronomonas pharaonis DSM 2160]
MTRDETAPMVPIMPADDRTDDTIRADGGRRKRYDREEVLAPLVADLR